ncbi:MAG: HAD hydrolase family protein, partial [Malacoplasma sp.]
MNTKYIFIDIDATLLDHETGIPSSAIYAINEARKKHKVFICTGRPYTNIDDEIKNIEFDGYICGCGSYVIIEHKKVFVSCMQSSHVKEIKKLLEHYRIGYNLEGEDKSFLDNVAFQFFSTFFCDIKTNESLKTELMNNRKMYQSESITNEDYEHILKISTFGNSQEECDNLIKNLPSGLQTVLHSYDNVNIDMEISDSTISKATGIDIVLKHFNACIENTIA